VSLAIAELSCLLAGVYLNYRTSLVGDYSPVINSRFELFYDTRFANVKVPSAFIRVISDGEERV
jgi:hypothetical protein